MVEVKVYSTPTCPYCHMVKDFLKEKGIEYEDINVQEDEEARKEMIERSGEMGVPQILIGDKLIIGFNKPAIEEALKE